MFSPKVSSPEVSTTVDDFSERLAAIDLVRTRFAGRAGMRARCDRSQVPAYERDLRVTKLEHRLGLASDEDLISARRTARLERACETYPQHAEEIRATVAYHGWDHVEKMSATTFARFAGKAGRYVEVEISKILAPDHCIAVTDLRIKRARSKDLPGRFTRTPGYAERQIAERRGTSIIRAAGFRSAAHSHEESIVGVDRGQESALSASGSDWASNLGMSAAYCRAAYRCATSEHTWRVSAAILSAEVRVLQAEASMGTVYLRVDLRVRQGRGTSLTVERRVGARGGWEVQS